MLREVGDGFVIRFGKGKSLKVVGRVGVRAEVEMSFCFTVGSCASLCNSNFRGAKEGE